MLNFTKLNCAQFNWLYICKVKQITELILKHKQNVINRRFELETCCKSL